MELQAGRFGAGLCKEKVISVERRGENFLLTTQNCSLIARSILMATGVVNNRPPMSDRAHSDALQRGLLRYCPVCDGFEAKNMKIAVIGCDGHGVSEALFLRRYSSSVTLLTLQRPNISECDQRELEETGVTVVFAPISDIAFEERTIAITTDLNPNVSLRFDTLYPALGTEAKTSIGAALGLATGDDQCLLADAHQRTTVSGIYAAGDVVLSLDQISVAMGQAAIAATAIHNDLRVRDLDAGALEVDHSPCTPARVGRQGPLCAPLEVCVEIQSRAQSGEWFAIKAAHRAIKAC